MDSHSKPTALITGIDGFTGQYLKKTLENQGICVFGTTHSRCNIKNSYVMDITDSLAVSKVINLVKPDYIIHLAAISFVAHSDPTEFYRVNVVGTECLLQSIIDSGLSLRKVIISSSANVYGNSSAEQISENISPEPVNHYACSKMAMEKITANYFNRLPIIITRPFNYTGVGQAEHFLVPKIVAHFKNGKKKIELGNTDVYRDFSSVEFVVQAYASLLNSDVKSEIINVCSGHSYSLQEIIETLEELAGYKIEICVNSDFVRADEVKKITGDNSKLLTIVPKLYIKKLARILEDMYLNGIKDD
ncbi:GDP-mannose 4,6-dehydratase [Paraglaciecola sp. L1A13]|uniref:GDP-mannose 4,6-dehydratase n=1 Tax=Paraglaciecola sp. L1A13 TaxID=2686359 RepID=UPI00131E06AB|nr:GDP-mannose 4,6-dehydratase [Paraglaciecola sp. L1A13]